MLLHPEEFVYCQVLVGLWYKGFWFKEFNCNKHLFSHTKKGNETNYCLMKTLFSNLILQGILFLIFQKICSINGHGFVN